MASDIRAGGAFVELFTKDSAFRKGLDKAAAKLRSFGRSVAVAGAGISAIGGALMTPLALAVNHFVDAGSALNDMSARTGVSAQALAELGYAAEQSGTDLETVEKAMVKMQKKGIDPNKFDEVAARIAAIEDPTKRAQAAIAAFGTKAGSKLLPMIADLKALRQEARDAGIGPSQKDVANADALGDAWDRTKATFKAGLFNVGAALAEPLLKALKVIQTVVGAISRWISQNRQLFVIIAAVAAGLLALGAALTAFGFIMMGLGAALSVVSTILGVIGSVIGFLLSPIGLVIAAITALVAGTLYATGTMGKAWDWLKAKFGALGAFFSETLGGIVDALMAGDIPAAAEVMWAALNLAWVHGINFVKGIWNSFTGWLVKTLSAAWTGLLAGAEIIWHGLTVGWIETVGAVSKGWNIFVGFFQKSWATMKSWAQKSWNTIKGWFDKSVNAKEANAAIDRKLEEEKRGIDAKTDNELKRLENERKAKRDKESQAHEGALAEIGQAHENRVAAVDAANAQSAKAAEDRLNAARGRFKGAIADAKAKREAADAKSQQDDKTKKPKVPEAVTAEGGLLTAGTFNARAIQAGALAVTKQELQLAALERIAENTDPLKDAEGIEIE